MICTTQCLFHILVVKLHRFCSPIACFKMLPHTLSPSRRKGTMFAFHCFFSHYASPCASSCCIRERMHNHIGCIYTISLRCEFSCGSSCAMDKRHSHTHCICRIFHRCVFSYAFSNYPIDERHIHTDCICGVSLLRVSSYVFSNYSLCDRQIHTGNISRTPFPHCEWSCASSNLLLE